MILVGLRLKIDGFWACKLSEEFKGVEFRVVDIHPSKDYSRGLLTVAGKEDLMKIRDSLSSLSGITSTEILLDEIDGKLISFYFKHGPLGEIILKTGVHIKPPLELEDGVIKVNLMGAPMSINRFLKYSEELKDVSIEIIRKSELKYIGKPRLTKKQERILKTAIKFGYYDVPRKISTTELAKKLNLSPSTVAEHLRKAENRVIKDYF